VEQRLNPINLLTLDFGYALAFLGFAKKREDPLKLASHQCAWLVLDDTRGPLGGHSEPRDSKDRSADGAG
jgi:hypothetical protein